MNPFQISMYPFAIGLAYFLPLDLSFSCWFFFVLRLAEQVLGAVFGWEQIPGFPFFGQQASGAWLVLGVMAIWASRHWLMETLRVALKPSEHQKDANEPIRFRWAWVGLLVSTPALVAFTKLMGNGSADVDSFFWTVFFLFSIAITRVRAELGAPHEIVYAQPRNIVADLFGDEPLFAQRVDSNFFDPLVQPGLPMSPNAGNVGSLQVRPTFRHRSKVYGLARLCHLPFLNPCDLLGELACLLPRRGDSEVHRV
jgi:hypothetical protein